MKLIPKITHKERMVADIAHEDDHTVGECEEGDYVGNDTKNLSPQHVHQVYEATTHFEDRGYENFDHFNKIPTAIQGDQPQISELEIESALEGDIMSHLEGCSRAKEKKNQK